NTERTNRSSRLIEEARDPEVAVIVMDFVLGLGSHEDPVGSTIETIKEAKAIAAAEGRELIILAYVLGTDLDTPSLEQQSQMLLDAGVILASRSTNRSERRRVGNVCDSSWRCRHCTV